MLTYVFVPVVLSGRLGMQMNT